MLPKWVSIFTTDHWSLNKRIVRKVGRVVPKPNQTLQKIEIYFHRFVLVSKKWSFFESCKHKEADEIWILRQSRHLSWRIPSKCRFSRTTGFTVPVYFVSRRGRVFEDQVSPLAEFCSHSWPVCNMRLGKHSHDFPKSSYWLYSIPNLEYSECSTCLWIKDLLYAYSFSHSHIVFLACVNVSGVL